MVGRSGQSSRLRRNAQLASIVATLAVILAGTATSALGKAGGTNGRIAFARETGPAGDAHASYAVDPDGSRLRQIVAGRSDFPRWSPDGSEVSLGDMGCQFDGTCAAVIADPRTGDTRVLPNPDRTQFSGVFCDSWSPDGARLACGAEGDGPSISGVYTIRSSDGGGLTKIVSCDAFGAGAECGPTDYSPDGRRLLLFGPDQDGDPQLFLIGLDGGGLHRLTRDGTLVDGNDGVASWSPDGDQILFGGYTDTDHRRSVFVVDADGTGLHQVPIPGCGGPRSAPISSACYDPGWSPDGSRIVFSRTTVSSAGATVSNIYTSDPDGSHVFQVTHQRSGFQVTASDWGTRRVTGANPPDRRTSRRW